MDSVRGRVLVVEDDPEINELVGAYAQIAGFHYDAALNGTVALSKAHDETPALILLDVMLPDLDGFEVCRRLKSDQTTSRIPVIIFTALDRDEYRVRGQQCGAVAYMTKPFDPERLMETIRQVVLDNGCLTKEP
ncbi:MAG: response regulator transcription factor [Bacillota bacterium]